jgi:catechol O-methyltransferase
MYMLCPVADGRPLALTCQGDGREQALLKHLQSDPALSDDANKDVSLQDRSQKVLDAIHEFGKGENKYLMSVGETKGKQVEALIKSKKPKVSGCQGWIRVISLLTCQLILELGAYVGYSGISFSRVSADGAMPSPRFTAAAHASAQGLPFDATSIKVAADSQHLLDVHPNSIYPGDWTSDTNEDRAGYITLEKSDVYAATAQGAFDLAGLHKVLKVSSSSAAL